MRESGIKLSLQNIKLSLMWLTLMLRFCSSLHFDDPLYPSQWPFQSYSSFFGINIMVMFVWVLIVYLLTLPQKAWEANYRGKGVTIGFIVEQADHENDGETFVMSELLFSKFELQKKIFAISNRICLHLVITYLM
jgi:hypothetical protein